MLKLKQKTESIWTYIYLERERFTNKFYNPLQTKEVVEQIPLTAHFTLKEWREWHFKWAARGYDTYNQESNRAFQYENCVQAVVTDNLRA